MVCSHIMFLFCAVVGAIVFGQGAYCCARRVPLHPASRVKWPMNRVAYAFMLGSLCFWFAWSLVLLVIVLLSAFRMLKPAA